MLGLAWISLCMLRGGKGGHVCLADPPKSEASMRPHFLPSPLPFAPACPPGRALPRAPVAGRAAPSPAQARPEAGGSRARCPGRRARATAGCLLDPHLHSCIALRRREGDAEIVVSDDGVGIPDIRKRNSGMKLNRGLASQIQGQLEIDSGNNRGTRVTLRFPIAPGDGQSNAGEGRQPEIPVPLAANWQ